MTRPVAVVLDTSALIEYARGPVEGLAVAELISEVRAEGRLASISVLALTDAMVSPLLDKDLGRALLEWFLTEHTGAIAVDLARRDVPSVAALAADFGIGIPLAHSVLLALRHEAHFATADPATALRVLGDDWPVLDISGRPFAGG